VGIMLVMLLLTGSIVSPGAIPLLVISVVMGVLVGGLLGVLGAAWQASVDREGKGKSVIDEL
jgi:hypothetical protein